MRPSPVCVMGAGNVGLVTAVCLADGGVVVRLYDIDPDKVALLRQGHSPIHIVNIEALLCTGLSRGTLTFCDDVAVAMDNAEMALLAVGTPPHRDGRADLRQVRMAIAAAIAHAKPGAVIVIKSTIPPGSTATLMRLCRRNGHTFPVVMSPEFLREGSAIEDYLNPSQVVIGGNDHDACARVALLFAHPTAPTVITDSTSAELIKYGTNSFLALKISSSTRWRRSASPQGPTSHPWPPASAGTRESDGHFLALASGSAGRVFPRTCGR
jgi:UDPglucose 6-dehydrogenase